MISSIVIGILIVLVFTLPLVIFLEMGWGSTAVVWFMVWIGGFMGYCYHQDQQPQQQTATVVTISAGD